MASTSPRFSWFGGGSRDWLILVAGFLFNVVLFSLNNVVATALNHGDYTPFSAGQSISAQIYDETQTYAPGPRRFLNGGKLDAEMDLVELRGVPNAYPVLHTFLIGFLARITGSLEVAWMLCHAIFPALIWTLFFRIGWWALQSPSMGAAISWITCLFAFGPRNALLLGMYSSIQPLEITRTPQPAVSFLLFLAAIVLFARMLTLRSATSIILSGVAGGILFYAYYFYWVAFFSGAAALVLTLVMLRRWTLVKPASTALTVGIVTAVPYLVWTYLGMHSGLQQNLLLRMGEFSRKPDVPGLVLAAAFAMLLFGYCRSCLYPNSDGLTVLQSSLLATTVGSAVGLNFQLLSGYNAQHNHFYNRALQPLAIFTLALLFAGHRRVRERIHGWPARLTASVLIVVFVGFAGFRQIQTARLTAGAHRQSSPQVDVLLWLRSHTPSDAVLGSSDRELLTLIPAITGEWNFVPMGNRSMATTQEILTRYLMVSRLENRTWADVDKALEERGDDWNHPFSLYGVLIGGPGITPQNLALAHGIWDGLDLTREFRSRRLDYLVTPNVPDGVPPGALAGYPVVYRNAVWRVLKITAGATALLQ